MSYKSRVADAIRNVGPKPVDGYTAAELGAAIGFVREEMTADLGCYRDAQKSMVAPEFVIGCEGYGTAARWFVLAADDPAFVADFRRHGHTRYVLEDAVTRFLRDRLMEVDPGLVKRSTTADKIALAATDQAMKQLEAVAVGMVANLVAMGVPTKVAVPAKTP